MSLSAAVLLLIGLAAVGGDARDCVCAATRDGDGVNVRKHSKTKNSDIIGFLDDGVCADYLGKSKGVWHKIQLVYPTGVIGWIHGDYVSGPQSCGGHGDYCTATLCSSFLAYGNMMRTCDSYGCGNYGASRGSGTHKGSDIRCEEDDETYAPFDGYLARVAPPYGDGTCCDTGYLLQGTGIWQAYEVKVFYQEPDPALIKTNVVQGQPIGHHVGLHCGNCYGPNMTDHTHVQFYRDGQVIDGTSFVMCY